MKLFLNGIIFSILCLRGVSLCAAEVKRNFEYFTPITGAVQPGVINRVILTPDILAAAKSPSCADLRLFDDSGQEIPSITYDHRMPLQSAQTQLIPVSYVQDASEARFILKAANGETVFNRINIAVNGRDFKKSVTVRTSNDGRVWTDCAVDTIFDFTSQIDLRKTYIDLPAVSTAAYVQLIISSDVTASIDDPQIALSYRDVRFSINEHAGPPFRISNVRCELKDGILESKQVTAVKMTAVRNETDKDGNSLIYLGQVNLPVDIVTLSVDTAWFSRKVEVWAGDDADVTKHVLQRSGVLFRIPGINTHEESVELGSIKSKYVVLKIINGDNTPLRISAVTFSWTQKDLFFIPEKAGSYSLFFGNKHIPAPLYDLVSVVKPDNRAIFEIPALNTGSVTRNSAFDPMTPPEVKRRRAVLAFKVFILILVFGMMAWVFKLIKKIGDSSS